MPSVTSDPATLPNRLVDAWPTVCEQADEDSEPHDGVDASDDQERHALVAEQPDQGTRRRRFGWQVEFSHVRLSNAAICSRVTVSASAPPCTRRSQSIVHASGIAEAEPVAPAEFALRFRGVKGQQVRLVGMITVVEFPMRAATPKLGR